MNKKNKAFTLAETLIVILVIGVIAVFLMNALGKASPDKNKVLFKKAYSVTEKTVQEIIDDETLYPYSPNYPGLKNTKPVVIPSGCVIFDKGTVFKSGIVTAANNVCKTNNPQFKFPLLFVDKLNIVDKAKYQKDNSGECLIFKTSDGINWKIYTKATIDGSEMNKIVIDTNGFDNPPNTRNYSCAKKTGLDRVDTFEIYVNFDGKIITPSDEVDGCEPAEKLFLMSSSTKADDYK